MLRDRLLLAVIGSLAGWGFVAATWTALALIWPFSVFGETSDMAPVHEARAHALANRPHPTAGEIEAARRETEAGLRQSVANPTAWLRLAYLDSLGPAGLTEEGRRALARSYAVAPFGPDDTPWRLEFALDHWREIGQPLRLDVLEEMALVQRHRPHLLREVAQRADDPSGRLAVALVQSRRER